MDQARLPDLVLLDIIRFGDVGTLKAFRLSCRHMCNLIARYEQSVCSTLASRCFDEDRIRLSRCYSTSSLDMRSILWIESRLRRSLWLAGIMLEQYIYDENGFEPLTAADPTGFEIRNHITNGLSVLWNLADIAHDVRVEHLPTIRSPGEEDQPLCVKRTYALWQKFGKQLTCQEKFNYRFMLFFLHPAFQCRVFEEPDSERYGVGAGGEYIEGNSWLSWLVFSSGPKLFEKAWSSLENNKNCTALVQEEWASKSYNELLWEYRAGRKIEAFLRGNDEGWEEAKEKIGRCLGTTVGLPRVGELRSKPFHLGHELSSERLKKWGRMMKNGNLRDTPRLLQFT